MIWVDEPSTSNQSNFPPSGGEYNTSVTLVTREKEVTKMCVVGQEEHGLCVCVCVCVCVSTADL